MKLVFIWEYGPLTLSQRKRQRSSLPSHNDDRPGVTRNLFRTISNPLLWKEVTFYFRSLRKDSFYPPKRTDKVTDVTFYITPATERRAANTYAHVHTEQQHYLLSAHFNHNSDSCKPPWNLGTYLMRISDRTFFLPSGTLITQKEFDSSSGWLRRTLLSTDTAGYTASRRTAPALHFTYLCIGSEKKQQRRSFTYLSLSPGRGMTALHWLTATSATSRNHRAVNYYFALQTGSAGNPGHSPQLSACREYLPTHFPSSKLLTGALP